VSNINTTVPDNRDLSNFPGEYGLPFLGKTIEVVKDSIAVCNDHFKRFGAVSKIDMVRGQRVLMCLGPEFNEAALFDKDGSFSSAGGYASSLGSLYPDGMLLRDNAKHKKTRRASQPSFKTDALKTYVELLNPIQSRRIDMLPKDEEFLFYDAIQETLMDVAAKVFIGLDEKSPEAQKLHKILKPINKKITTAYKVKDKTERHEALKKLKDESIELCGEDFEENKILTVFKEMESEIVRSSILKTGKRIDGRDTKTVRPIVSEVGVLPRTHGSALFTRGETQALVVATLGTGSDEQIIDALEGESRSRFMLHYNFPPFSVGEVGRTGSPGRREIGHGKLAWRSLNPVLPEHDQFPYTIRLVSEITESNGSSSMATVCGSSLAIVCANKSPEPGVALNPPVPQPQLKYKPLT